MCRDAPRDEGITIMLIGGTRTQPRVGRASGCRLRQRFSCCSLIRWLTLSCDRCRRGGGLWQTDFLHGERNVRVSEVISRVKLFGAVGGCSRPRLPGANPQRCVAAWSKCSDRVITDRPCCHSSGTYGAVFQRRVGSALTHSSRGQQPLVQSTKLAQSKELIQRVASTDGT